MYTLLLLSTAFAGVAMTVTLSMLLNKLTILRETRLNVLELFFIPTPMVLVAACNSYVDHSAPVPLASMIMDVISTQGYDLLPACLATGALACIAIHAVAAVFKNDAFNSAGNLSAVDEGKRIAGRSIYVAMCFIPFVIFDLGVSSLELDMPRSNEIDKISLSCPSGTVVAPFDFNQKTGTAKVAVFCYNEQGDYSFSNHNSISVLPANETNLSADLTTSLGSLKSVYIPPVGEDGILSVQLAYEDADEVAAVDIQEVTKYLGGFLSELGNSVEAGSIGWTI